MTVESFLERDEIIRRCKARLGFTTNASQAPLVQQEFEELVRSAAIYVFSTYEWPNVLRSTEVTIGIDQVVINYPANSGADDIQEVSWWDGSRWVQLGHRYIPNSLTDDPKFREGEPNNISGRSNPLFFQCKKQIEIVPRPDKEYSILIRHTVTPDMNNGTDKCIVDAELIIWTVIAWKRYDMGDDMLGQKAEDAFEARRAFLARKVAPTAPAMRNSLRHARVNRSRSIVGYIPNSGQWPSVKP